VTTGDRTPRDGQVAADAEVERAACKIAEDEVIAVGERDGAVAVIHRERIDVVAGVCKKDATCIGRNRERRADDGNRLPDHGACMEGNVTARDPVATDRKIIRVGKGDGPVVVRDGQPVDVVVGVGRYGLRGGPGGVAWCVSRIPQPEKTPQTKCFRVVAGWPCRRPG
jgi:hypothetical protein